MLKKEYSHRIYLQARRFEDSAELLFKVGNFDPNKYYIPAWVLGAFALELHLKSILFLEKGVIKKTHTINKIFESLEVESKNKIKANFELDILQNIPHGSIDLERESGIKISDNFEDVLKDISSLFVEFRYIFEQRNEGKSFFYIDHLRRAITARVSELGIDKK